MKNMKKTLLCILCVIAVAAASVMGTLAYLTDTDSAVNTFTVGKVDITLDEEAVTPDGKPTPEEDERVQENGYHLLPGQTYVKDPTVTVKAGSEESYVRMLVTLNCRDALQEIFGEGFLPQDYVEGWDSEIWVSTGVAAVDEEANTVTYEFRYHETVDGYTVDAETGEEVAADEILPALFTEFTCPGILTGDDLAKLEGFTITVNGHAIQKAGFAPESTEGAEEPTEEQIKAAEDAAWAAFDEQLAAQPNGEVPEASEGE